MHAVIVNVTLNDEAAATAFLKEQIVPRISQAPGFVSGVWARSAEGKGGSMIVFESEEAANAAAAQIESGGRPPEEAATIDSVEVREVVATA